MPRLFVSLHFCGRCGSPFMVPRIPPFEGMPLCGDCQQIMFPGLPEQDSLPDDDTYDFSRFEERALLSA